MCVFCLINDCAAPCYLSITASFLPRPGFLTLLFIFLMDSLMVTLKFFFSLPNFTCSSPSSCFYAILFFPFNIRKNLYTKLSSLQCWFTSDLCTFFNQPLSIPARKCMNYYTCLQLHKLLGNGLHFLFFPQKLLQNRVRFARLHEHNLYTFSLPIHVWHKTPNLFSFSLSIPVRHEAQIIRPTNP